MLLFVELTVWLDVVQDFSVIGHHVSNGIIESTGCIKEQRILFVVFELVSYGARTGGLVPTLGSPPPKITKPMNKAIFIPFYLPCNFVLYRLSIVLLCHF